MWTVDDDGFVWTPAGMKAARLTEDAELEMMDKVIHAPVRIKLDELLGLWAQWIKARHR